MDEFDSGDVHKNISGLRHSDAIIHDSTPTFHIGLPRGHPFRMPVTVFHPMFHIIPTFHIGLPGDHPFRMPVPVFHPMFHIIPTFHIGLPGGHPFRMPATIRDTWF
jgi:hypothetical protein